MLCYRKVVCLFVVAHLRNDRRIEQYFWDRSVRQEMLEWLISADEAAVLRTDAHYEALVNHLKKLSRKCDFWFAQMIRGGHSHFFMI